MFIYNNNNLNKSHKKSHLQTNIKQVKSSKLKKQVIGGQIKSLHKENIKFLTSLGFKVRKAGKKPSK